MKNIRVNIQIESLNDEDILEYPVISFKDIDEAIKYLEGLREEK